MGAGVLCVPGLGAIVDAPGTGVIVEPCPVISPVVGVKSQTGFWQHGWL